MLCSTRMEVRGLPVIFYPLLSFQFRLGMLDAKVQVRHALSPVFIIVTDWQKRKMEKRIISSCQSN